jgi:hypothetical protein
LTSPSPSLPETAAKIYRRLSSKHVDVVVFDFGRGAATEDQPTGRALNGFIRIDVGREINVVVGDAD